MTYLPNWMRAGDFPVVKHLEGLGTVYLVKFSGRVVETEVDEDGEERETGTVVKEKLLVVDSQLNETWTGDAQTADDLIGTQYNLF